MQSFDTSTLALLPSRTAKMEDLELAMLQARDEERRAIARDLHDVMAQLLVELDFAICGVGTNGAREEAAHELIANLQRQVRSLTYVLHPPELERYGLRVALESLALGLATRTGIDIAFRSRGYRKGAPLAMELAMLRVAQEALMNVFKHSGSQRAEMRLHCEPGWMCLRVRDFGLGKRAKSAIERGSGVGLGSMRARMQKLGGNVCVRPLEGGTSVTAIVRKPIS